MICYGRNSTKGTRITFPVAYTTFNSIITGWYVIQTTSNSGSPMEAYNCTLTSFQWTTDSVVVSREYCAWISIGY